MKYSFLFLAILLFSCAGEDKKSDAVPSDQVYQHYTVTFNEGSAKTTAAASFRVGAKWDRMETEKTEGSAMVLTSPASITCNGNTLAQKSDVFTGAYYELEKNGAFDGNYTWVWKDNKGQTFTNAAKMNSIALPALPETTYVEKELTITWTGGPVAENETVRIWLINGQNKATEFSSSPGTNALTFSSGALKNVEGNNVKVELSRTLHAGVQQGGAEGGTMDVVYNAESKNLRVMKTPVLKLF